MKNRNNKAVYQEADNVLTYFNNGLHYYGFENGKEKDIRKEPVTIGKQTINPGDKIVGFGNGIERSSFLLSYDYMTYAGLYNGFMLFDVYDSKSEPKQSDLFQSVPKWFLCFMFFPERFRIQIFSSYSTSWDIVPDQVIFYNNGQSF